MVPRESWAAFPDCYGDLRTALVHYLRALGSPAAEDLADETILRLVSKLKMGEKVRDLLAFAKGIAYNVFQESIREPRMVPMTSDHESQDSCADAESLDDCLTVCIRRLSKKDQRLIRTYYDGDGQSLIERRRRLAEELGITVDALRFRVFQIRKQLRQCIDELRRERGF